MFAAWSFWSSAITSGSWDGCSQRNRRTCMTSEGDYRLRLRLNSRTCKFCRRLGRRLWYYLPPRTPPILHRCCWRRQSWMYALFRSSLLIRRLPFPDSRRSSQSLSRQTLSARFSVCLFLGCRSATARHCALDFAPRGTCFLGVLWPQLLSWGRGQFDVERALHFPRTSNHSGRQPWPKPGLRLS